MIPKTLLKFSPEVLENKAKVKLLKTETKDIFKSIQGYMKDRFHPYPITLASELLRRGQEEPFLRDEIYVQLIKQTSENVNLRSELLGWKLIYLCLLTFAPQEEETRKCLLTHIAGIANPNLSQYVGLDTSANVATNCFKALEEVTRTGNPEAMLTDEKITEITVRFYYLSLSHFFLAGK
jgi:hypothetical protein